MISHGSEGELQNRFLFLRLYVSVISHGSERRPEEMICLKKVKIENGIWFVLILFFGLIVLCVFYYSLVNISKQSAIKEKKLLNKN